jgi:hypothetical protein
VDPADSDHILLGPADNVDAGARIEVSRDGGLTWIPASDGLTVPWPHHMVERFVPAGGNLLAVLSNGELLTAQIGRWAWRPALPLTADEHVRAATVISD